jgi:hypothetical protein
MPVQDDPGPATDSAAVPAETAVSPTPTDEPEPVLPYSIDAPGQSDAPPPFDTAVVWRAPDPGPAPEPTDSPVWQADPIPIATDLTPAQTHDDGLDAAADPDSFTPQDAGYVLYQNARFGTFLAYPSATFAPDPAPDNGDGRRFTSHDGSAEVLVWSQYNSMGQTSTDLLAQARGSIGLTQEVLGNAQEGLYEVEGAAGELHVYEKGIVEGPDGLIRVFRISFPQARFDEFAPIAAAMIASFGPGTSL